MKRFLLALAFSSTLLAGCGGGGGSTNVFGPQTIHTYISDTFREDYDQVWVRIYRVVLNGPTPAVLFDDPVGRVVDLRTLRDASGARFSYLNTAEAESAVYAEMAVTVDTNLTIVPAGGSAGQVKEFSDLHDDGGRSTLRFSLLGFNLVSAQSLVVDFNLAAWTIEGNGKVRALIEKGDSAGITSQLRHEPDDFRGTVSGVTGASPDLVFTLKRSSGSDLTVRMNNKTRVFNESGAISPSVTNTAGVEVSGIFVGGNFIATSVKIEDQGGGNAPEVEGAPDTANEAAGSFRVSLARAHNFIPVAKHYTVRTDAATRFLSDKGTVLTKSQFFAALAGAAVEAEGTPSASGEIDATRVKIDADGSLNEVSITGTLDTIDANSFTFGITQWQGISLRTGDVLTANLSGSTTYVLNGASVSKAAFFAAVAANDEVDAEGIYNGAVFTVLRLSANP